MQNRVKKLSESWIVQEDKPLDISLFAPLHVEECS